jgi:DNA-directed RNA polymerase specialized sigma24 family protein
MANMALAAPAEDDRLLELDVALEKLQGAYPRPAELVKLRFFAGLTSEQAAESLGISAATADRDWSYARAWLLREMSQS